MLQFAVLTKRIKIERASEGVGEGGLGRRVTGNFSSHPQSRPPSPHATADCNRSPLCCSFTATAPPSSKRATYGRSNQERTPTTNGRLGERARAPSQRYMAEGLPSRALHVSPPSATTASPRPQTKISSCATTTPFATEKEKLRVFCC